LVFLARKSVNGLPGRAGGRTGPTENAQSGSIKTTVKYRKTKMRFGAAIPVPIRHHDEQVKRCISTMQSGIEDRSERRQIKHPEENGADVVAPRRTRSKTSLAHKSPVTAVCSQLLRACNASATRAGRRSCGSFNRSANQSRSILSPATRSRPSGSRQASRQLAASDFSNVSA